MLKHVRLLLAAALLLMLSSIALGGVTLAQETDIPVFCGDLAEEDCDLLTNAQLAQAQAESGTVSFNADFNISNIPDAPFESLNFVLTGDGAYALDPSVMASLMEMQGDPSAMMENMEMFPQLIEDFFNGFAGELSLTLTLPEELTSMMASGDAQIPETLSVDLVLVDGIGYINLDQIAEAAPQAGLPAGWYGIELARIMGMTMEQSMSMMGDMSQMPGFDPSLFTQFSSPEFIGQYATLERMEDEEGLAVFSVTFDYAGFFASPEFQEIITQQMEATGEEIDPAEMDEAMGMMGQMFQDMTLEARTYINTTDNTIQRQTTSFSWDMSALMEIAAAEGSEMTAAPVIDFNAEIEYGDFNAGPEITAPEDVVTILTAEQALMFGPAVDGTGATMDPNVVTVTPESSGESGDLEGDATAEATPGS